MLGKLLFFWVKAQNQQSYVYAEQLSNVPRDLKNTTVLPSFFISTYPFSEIFNRNENMNKRFEIPVHLCGGFPFNKLIILNKFCLAQ